MFDTEMTDRETMLVGKIVTLWGSFEGVIFQQILSTFPDVTGPSKLPKPMNGMQFTSILDLWRERVAATAAEAAREVLLRVYDRAVQLMPFRNALVHGMLVWGEDGISSLTSIRVRKNEVIRVKLMADDLADMMSELGEINYDVRWPNGHADRERALSEDGFYISRRGLAMLSGHDIANDWLDLTPPSGSTGGGS